MATALEPSRSDLFNFSLSDDQQRLIEISDRLSRERFAERATKHDLEGTFPSEDYEDLVAHGLTSMNIPTEYGGVGADPLTYALVLKNIARGNASTGLTLNMHSTVTLFLNVMASQEQKKRYFGEVVRNGDGRESAVQSERFDSRGLTSPSPAFAKAGGQSRSVYFLTPPIPQ